MFKKSIAGLYLSLLSLLLVGCLTIPTGDGGSVKLSTKGVQIKTAEGEETTINVNAKDKSISITDAEGQETNVKVDATEEGLSLKATGVDGQESTLNVDTKEGGINLTSTDEQGQVTEQSLGLNSDLPEGFPTDIPIPDEATDLIGMTNDSEDSKMYIVNYHVPDAKVYDYYQLYSDYLQQAGYDEIIDASNGSADPDTKLENLMAKSASQSLIIGISVSGTGKFDTGNVKVTLNYQEKK